MIEIYKVEVGVQLEVMICSYGRLYNKGSESASLQCSDVDILSQDNGRLPNPIGLITADEAALAGVTWNIQKESI